MMFGTGNLLESSRLRGALVIALLAVACESAPQGAPTLADIQGAKTRGEMLRVTTLEPARCTWSRVGFEICVWKLGDRNGAWYPLKESIDTRYRVNLICEFPADGKPTERDCLVVPAAAPPTTGSGKRRVRVSAAEAQGQLDAAGTVWQVTQLVGDSPQRCSAVDANTQFCVWKADGHTSGFGVLVKLLESRARVQLSCTFPADGSARAPGSCRAEPG
jgi:hypothetical protein